MTKCYFISGLLKVANTHATVHSNLIDPMRLSGISVKYMIFFNTAYISLNVDS